ncbi:MAG: nucleotide exchange factor GrpE [Myxococcota bacterium]
MSEQEQEVESVEEPSDAVQDQDASSAGEPDEIVEPESSDQDPESSAEAPTEDQDSDELDELFLSPDEGSEGVIEVDVVGDAESEPVGGEDGDLAEASGSVELEEAKKAHAEERDRLEKRIEELEEQVETARQESEQTRERLMRAAADLENFRKRSKREREELRKYGIDKLSLELIPAVDNLERALAHAEASEEESNILDGVKMVYKQIIAALEKHGVTGFDATGEQFNPEHHEAIQQVESSEHETGEVVDQFQKGYFIHDRLLRPALVSVAKRVEAEDNEEHSSDTENADEAPQDAPDVADSDEESEATQE